MPSHLNHKIISVQFVLLIVTLGPELFSQPNQNSKPNILFIAIDDMNDWAGFLNTHPQIKTPNLDAAAQEGFYFVNAHCPAPICGPSRTAILSGRWPTSSGIYTNDINYRMDMAKHISLPAYFRKYGYQSMGRGKIFHSGAAKIPDNAFDEYGGKGASAQPFASKDLQLKLQTPFHELVKNGKTFRLPLNGMPADRHWGTSHTFDWGAVDLPDSLFFDTKTANWTIEKLALEYDKPFFIATGFTRPHQPLYNPKRFHDLYPIDSTILPTQKLHDLDDVPRSGREYALAASTSGLHKTVVEYNEWRHAVSCYLASISYIDDLIGRILTALDSSEHAENTIVVIFSDHGWHLGEKEHWGKETGWLRSTRVPLIILPPKNQSQKFIGKHKIEETVNLIDLGPTLTDLIEISPNPNWEGRSLAPLLKGERDGWYDVTHTTFGFGNHTVSTPDWQYIQYFDGKDELYHLPSDHHQFDNLVDQSPYANIVENLRSQIPEEPKFKYFVRKNNYKALIPADGSSTILFNLAYQNHINQQTDVAKNYPDIVSEINNWIEKNQPTNKNIIIDP